MSDDDYQKHEGLDRHYGLGRFFHFFLFTVIDEATGRGVPMVELALANGIRFFSDSNGVIVLQEPSLMDKEVFFQLRSHGYEYVEELSGARGFVCLITQGGSVILRIKRLNLAERLYRVTGEGIYRDSVLAGLAVPLRHPLLNGGVVGQDTVAVALYQGRLFWCWGDTLGLADANVGVAGAVSELPQHGGLDQGIGVNLTYFVDEKGFSKGMFSLTGPGRVWVDWLVSLKDGDGTERLVARYSRMRSLNEAYERGLAIFNDQEECFEPIGRLQIRSDVPHRVNHPFRAAHHGADFIFFTAGFSLVRAPADLGKIADVKCYESFTCLQEGSSFDGVATALERGPDGSLRYGWKKNTNPLGLDCQQELIASGRIAAHEGWVLPHDIDTGAAIDVYPGSIFWNAFRQRWLMIGQKDMGEVWCGEADTPVGPWVYCKRVLTHDGYTFYNPTQHPFFDQEGGRLIYFEGTYTKLFSETTEQTPRYDYNQIMYRLDLASPEIQLPAPVYRVRNKDGSLAYLAREEVVAQGRWQDIENIAFYAMPPSRRCPDLLPIFGKMEQGRTILTPHPTPENAGPVPTPLFFALPPTLAGRRTEISGTWQCWAKDPFGVENKFILELRYIAGRMTASVVPNTMSITRARFQQDVLELGVRFGDHLYQLFARLTEGSLRGQWQQGGTGLSGPWEGRRTDFVSNQAFSAMVVPLYAYCRGKDGHCVYATTPPGGDADWTRSALPICYVWRNPMSQLIIDYGIHSR